jgi:class 3 adenylate cyclase/tetratricopeptide (TPR) repeat protein
MQCPRCQHENASGTRFCGQCGASLTSVCGTCGTGNPAGNRFCEQCAAPLNQGASTPKFTAPDAYTPRHLAEKILTSRSALEGERKQVTVLFADLKRSMELLEDRDPEEARKLLDPVLEHMMEAVHRYEGTVNQVMGDGIMALFGAPVAHEDHAVRACYAALRMQDSVTRYAEDVRRQQDVTVRIRVGLNSGDVVVRTIGNDLKMDYTAVGQTTHLAARMEQMAEPGSILATADTVRLAEGYVETTPLGGLRVRGLEEPVDAYGITGTGRVRWRLEAAAARGFTGFVGREAELAAIRRAIENAADGHGQVIAVVGDPGVGKSRLFHEATRPGRMDGWLVLKTGAASYGKATAYQPVIDLLRAYFGLDDRDHLRDARDTIMTKVRALGEDPASMTPALLSLFEGSIEDPQWRALDPRQRRQQTMEAVRRLLLKESQAQRLCLVFEDLHWIDSETQAFLDTFIESLPTARVILLVNFRPEYRHHWGGKTYYAQLRIDPLPARNAEDLLRTLLGDDTELAALKKLLIERTEGNPFFLEESVRALVEDGVLVGAPAGYRLGNRVQEIRIPATVHAVLAARIDRLQTESKRVLQCASVIGENIPFRLLAEVADLPEPELRQSLAQLRATEFLYDISPFQEPEYAFRHGLTRKVAYDSLLRERRRALHARTVAAIERFYPDRLGEHLERLASHAHHGELWDQAARYLQQAGTKAFEKSANREAVAWFEQALEVVPRLPESPETQAQAVDLHLGLRNALTLLGEHDRALGHLREAQTLAGRLGDQRRLGRALSFEVNCLLLLGEPERAIESAHRARTIAEELRDIPLRVVTDMYAGRAHLHLGDFTRAIGIFRDVVGALTGNLAYDHLGIPVLPAVFARSHLVECLAEVGRFDESARFAEEAVALAETTKHPDTLLWAYHGAGVHHLLRGEARAAADAFERAYAVSRSHDMPAYRPRISSELALAQALDGHAIAAVPMVQQATQEAATRRQAASYSQVLLLLAEVQLLAHHLPEAAEAAASALTHFRQQRARGQEARALRLLGDIAARTAAGLATAERYYDDASALADKLDMHPLLARCQLGRAPLLAQTGRIEGARQALESACSSFRTLGMTADLERSEAALKTIAPAKPS